MSTAAQRRATTVPPREDWPEPPARTKGGERLTELIAAILRLNGALMDAAQDLAAAGGVTAAWWQVLGGIVDEPHSVADIARRMGMTRQGVQRVADLLVERGVAEYQPNPAHRRAKLLALTDAGSWAIRQIALVQRPWADQIARELDADNLHQALLTMRQLIAVLETTTQHPE
jgi:DNA-binding MarR family transcriptional regulator